MYSISLCCTDETYLYHVLLFDFPCLYLFFYLSRHFHTLALRGLEEPFFQLCCCVVSVFGSGGKCRNLLYIIFRQIVLGSSGKQFLVLRMYLVYNTVVRLCQFFCCGGKVNFVRIYYSHDRFSKILRTFFVKKMIPYKTYI